MTGLCRFNPRFHDQIQAETERFTFFSKGTWQIQPAMQGYAELGYFQTKTKANGTLGANNDAGVFLPGDPFNPLFVHNPMILPASHPQNTFGTDRVYFTLPYELGGRNQETDNGVFRGLVGLEGTAYGWDYNTGLLYVKSKLQNDNFGFIIWDQMQAALNNGTYLINRACLTCPTGTSAAVLSAISPTLSSEPTQLDHSDRLQGGTRSNEPGRWAACHIAGRRVPLGESHRPGRAGHGDRLDRRPGLFAV